VDHQDADFIHSIAGWSAEWNRLESPGDVSPVTGSFRYCRSIGNGDSLAVDPWASTGFEVGPIVGVSKLGVVDLRGLGLWLRDGPDGFRCSGAVEITRVTLGETAAGVATTLADAFGWD